MIFTNDELKQFELNDISYPILCDLIVLEKIQNEVGDIIAAEDKIRGFVPRMDADGVIDRTVGTWTIPDISLTCQALVWMMEEGQAVTEGKEEIPTVDDLKRQDEYTITDMALIVFEEFETCISGKKKKDKVAQKKTATKTQTKRR